MRVSQPHRENDRREGDGAAEKSPAEAGILREKGKVQTDPKIGGIGDGSTYPFSVNRFNCNTW